MNKNQYRTSRGQTIILLLAFVIIAIIVTTAAIISISVNIKATDKVYQGTTVYDLAESGAENAIIKLLRDNNYSGENLDLPQGTLEITVTGNNPKLIRSTAVIGNFIRTIEVSVDTSNNILTVLSWKETT
ncbi:hypothetical protein A3D78_02150 [Candidatus Gottesmanbacteria bacterium RIFCSPHIGHO2_02_FULL_39_14]|uniref:Type 4 fimbrial biogenesis protein PilX N-terminal domain-containing protein n=2 Tax=Candidatus Gottesmaniibacteriota TaxID=1752720 RepID=A0A1F6A2G5_9BACT|nr:MAG: hypothetical protein A2153_01960 [Candidatus Gottesmanbacteria bacterium RBG_16_38_7b]OGG18794.1 MAG: hypothetical protein A3D78_02150 [Candidatus Gottesmanbacteria bacterium RIFCSPHIGHO2_02_FULL_39_14]